jgi:hypothetical protein
LLTNEAEFITIEGLKKIGLKAIEKISDLELSLRADSALHLVYQGLQEIGLKAAEKGLSNETSAVLKSLEQIGLKCAEKRLDECTLERYGFIKDGGRSVTIEVMEAIKEIGVKAADKKLEKFSGFPVAVDAITGLLRIGLYAIKCDLSDDTVLASCSGLFKIGIKVAEKRLGFLGNPIGLIIDTSAFSEEETLRDKTHVVDDLKEIAKQAYEKKLQKTASCSMVYLWILGTFVRKYYPEDDAREMATKIRNSNRQVIRDLFGNNDIREKAKEWIKINCPQLESELKAFEGLYEPLS